MRIALVGLLVAVAAVAAPVSEAPVLCGNSPKALIVIETAPAVYADSENNTDQPGRVLRADGKAEYLFTDFGESPVGCELEAFPAPTPEVLAPEPLKCNAPGADPGNCIDPAYDPNTPPGEGPSGAEPVDKPA